MEDNKIDIYFEKNINLNRVYEIFSNFEGINLFCVDQDTFNWLPDEVFNFLKTNGYIFIIFFYSEDGWPVITLPKKVFKDEKFQEDFILNLSDLNYYLVCDHSEKYRLIQINKHGKTGIYVDI